MLATTLQLSKATVVTTAPPIVLQYTDLLNRKNL